MTRPNCRLCFVRIAKWRLFRQSPITVDAKINRTMAIELTFRVWDRYEPDDWALDGDQITSSAQLDKIRACFAAFRILLVKHWHYRGSRAPSLFVVEDIDEFLDYLKSEAVAGDAIDVYDITESIADDRRVSFGKCPDAEGLVPKRGAY